MKAIDIILIILITAALALAVRRVVVNRRRGKTCCGSCESCGLCAGKGREGR